MYPTYTFPESSTSSKKCSRGLICPERAILKCAPMKARPDSSTDFGTGSMRCFLNFGIVLTLSDSSAANLLTEKPRHPVGVDDR